MSTTLDDGDEHAGTTGETTMGADDAGSTTTTTTPTTTTPTTTSPTTTSPTTTSPTTTATTNDEDEPLPDLYPDYFYIDDHTLSPGQSTDMHFRVANAGEVENLYQFWLIVVMSEDDVVDDGDIVLYAWVYPYAVPPMGGSLWVGPIEIPDEAYDGEYFVGIYLDASDVIQESDETNNWLWDSDKLVVSGNPPPLQVDLAPFDVEAEETEVVAGTSTQFAFSVENLGTDALPAYSVGLYYSEDAEITQADTSICTYTNEDGIPGLGVEAHQVDCVVPDLDGTYYFGVVVDPNDAIAETDELNNADHDPVAITVIPLDVDLQMGTVVSASLEVDTGDVLDVSAIVSNGGSTPAPAFDTGFYLSTDSNITTNDTWLCTAPVGAGLQPGTHVDVESSCSVPLIASGSYWLGAIADPSDALPESDEGNNAGSTNTAIEVTAPDVDLEYNLHWDNANALTPGQTVAHHVQVRNNGTAASPASFQVNVHYSSDMNITLADPLACAVQLGPVPALTITEFQFDCDVPNVPAGWYYSGILIDPHDDVPETDETNNAGSDVNPRLIQ